MSVLFSGNDVLASSASLAARYRQQLREIRRGVRPHPTRIPSGEAPHFWIAGSALNRLVSHRLALLGRRSVEAGVPIEFEVFAVPPSEAWLDAWRAVEDVIRETRQASVSLGARYAVVSASTPWGVRGREGLDALRESYPAMRGRDFDLDAPDARLRAFCEAEGIPFLALQPTFRNAAREGGPPLHFEYDGHWTREGHDLAARSIADFLRARLALDEEDAAS